MTLLEESRRSRSEARGDGRRLGEVVREHCAEDAEGPRISRAESRTTIRISNASACDYSSGRVSHARAVERAIPICGKAQIRGPSCTASEGGVRGGEAPLGHTRPIRRSSKSIPGSGSGSDPRSGAGTHLGDDPCDGYVPDALLAEVEQVSPTSLPPRDNEPALIPYRPDRLAISVTEASAALGCSVSTVYRLIRSGDLGSARSSANGRIFVNLQSVRDFVEGEAQCATEHASQRIRRLG